MNESEINIFKALDFIRDKSGEYAKAKANRIYLEEFRKTKKAILMQTAERDGKTSSVSQERDAYAHEEYKQLLDGIKEAIEEEERLRWLLVAAQAKIEVWRSLGANARAEAKNL